MLIPLLGMYVTVLAFVVFSWLVDLWAKSYDLPAQQRIAKSALTACSALALGGSAAMSAVAFDRAAAGLHWIVLVAAAPAVAILLWVLYELDWRPVYVGAFLGLVGARVLLGAPLSAVGLMVIGVVALGLVSESGPLRFNRYVRTLEDGCSCCGYKQRAVHELVALGPIGETEVRRFLAQASAAYETRVRDELGRCRPTSA
jgi:hypothetical protein